MLFFAFYCKEALDSFHNFSKNPEKILFDKTAIYLKQNKAVWPKLIIFGFVYNFIFIQVFIQAEALRSAQVINIKSY